MTITQEQLNGWYEHKSNKEAWIEGQEEICPSCKRVECMCYEISQELKEE